MIDSRKMHKHVSFVDLGLRAWITLETIVPVLWLIKDMFLVSFFTKKVLHTVLLDVALNFDLGTKPFVDTEKEKPGVEAIKVLCGNEINVWVGDGRKKKFPLNVWIKN